MMYLYSYKGAVLGWGKLITEIWEGCTYAETERRARSNLAYRFKKEYGYLPNAKISLVGKVNKVVDLKRDDGEQLSFL